MDGSSLHRLALAAPCKLAEKSWRVFMRTLESSSSQAAAASVWPDSRRAFNHRRREGESVDLIVCGRAPTIRAGCVRARRPLREEIDSTKKGYFNCSKAAFFASALGRSRKKRRSSIIRGETRHLRRQHATLALSLVQVPEKPATTNWLAQLIEKRAELEFEARETDAR